MHWGRHFIFAAVIASATAASAFEVEGLAGPESFIVDGSTGNYFISNINGGPTQKNNAGFISKLDPSGKTLEREFIKGGKNGVALNAPKGLLIAGNTLYVADIDTVRGFDKETGKPSVKIDFGAHGARFLNDLTADSKGRLYVTDMTANRVFEVNPAKNFKISVHAAGKELGWPNGIRYHPESGRLVVASYKGGDILWIAPSGTVEGFMKISDAKLDGLDIDERGRVYVSSFQSGKIYRISPNKNVRVMASGLVTPADISLDRKNRLILVPSLNGNRAFTVRY